jgi:hypothetical protein
MKSVEDFIKFVIGSNPKGSPTIKYTTVNPKNVSIIDIQGVGSDTTFSIYLSL